MLTPALKTGLYYSGLSLLGLASIALLASLSGFISLPETLIGGETTLHSIARVAVIGCVLAAIGSWEQSSSK